MTEEQRERNRERQRKYREANRDAVNARSRRWWADNKEKQRGKKLVWQRANRDKVLASTKKWQAANPDKVKAARHGLRARWTPEQTLAADISHRRSVLRKYGLTEDSYQALLAAQGGTCAICAKPQNGRRLAIDHCHNSKVVRALLCMSCNNGLGRFRDDPQLLRAAAAYIESFLCP